MFKHATTLLFVCLLGHSAAHAQYGVIELDAVLLESSELLQNGQPEQALALMQRNQSRFGNSPEFINNLAVAYLGNAQPDQAISLLRQLLDSDPVFGILAHNLVELELQRPDPAPSTVNPVLFVQSSQSFFNAELASTTQPLDSTLSPSPTLPAPQPVVESSAVPTERPTASTSSPNNEFTLELIRITETWAEAWSAKDLTAYLGSYAEDFTPDSATSHAQWRRAREQALARPGEISVQLEDIEVQSAGSNMQVRFTQAYRSATYSDLVVKTLLFSQLDGRWKIVSETSAAISR